jgi:cytohesin
MKNILITIAAVVLVGCGPSVPDISIHVAVKSGNIEAVKQHLAAGTDVNAKSKGNGWTPLFYATSGGGQKEIAELLIAEGANVNAKDKLGDTSLQVAAYQGHKEIAELFIDNGADVNAKADNGKTPLDWADGETADILRKHGGKTGDWLNAGKSIHKAARAGHIEAVKQHIDAGTDVNAKDEYGMTPLYGAAASGHKEVSELLINKGADVNAKADNGKTPLDRADGETADILRKHGGKHSTINTAATAGDAEAVKEFLATGAEVNAKDGWGWTSLHLAVDGGHTEIVELLIAKGADVNAKDDDGDTPLDWAIFNKHPETADLLRKHGGKTGEELKAEGK